jgi:hypothetical protein
MTTTLPPKGSVWIHKKDGRIAIVKGYATITPESFPRPFWNRPHRGHKHIHMELSTP